MLRKIVTRIIDTVPFLLLGIGSIAVSAFVFVNGFELATNIDVPYAFAIEPVTVHELIDTNRSSEIVAQPTAGIGNFGEPKYLKLASQTTKLALVPAVLTDDGYLARASVGHFAYLGKAKNGNLGNTLIYVRTSWRSVGEPEQILGGTNVFIDTNKDWRYMYRVSDVVELPVGTPYIVPDSTKPHICLAFVSDDNTLVRIVVADFVNLQNIQQ